MLNYKYIKVICEIEEKIKIFYPKVYRILYIFTNVYVLNLIIQQGRCRIACIITYNTNAYFRAQSIQYKLISKVITPGRSLCVLEEGQDTVPAPQWQTCYTMCAEIEVRQKLSPQVVCGAQSVPRDVTKATIMYLQKEKEATRS